MLIMLLFYREHFYGFRKVIYENVEQKPFFSQQKNLYILVTEILKSYEVLFCTCCKGLFCL